jgi:hypothetical protein
MPVPDLREQILDHLDVAGAPVGTHRLTPR